MTSLITPIGDYRAVLGESPIWSQSEQALYWVDIKDPHILRHDAVSSSTRRWKMPTEVGSIGFAANDRLIVALRSGIAFFDPVTASLHSLTHPEKDRPGFRFNEGKVDPAGRFWVGSVEDPGFSPDGRLFCVDSDGRFIVKETAIAMPNALGWSPDQRTMYFADSFQRCIWAYDFSASDATISNRRVFALVPENEGYPDGLTVDSEGYVWNAQIDGWRIKRYHPAGKIDRVLELPVRRPTSMVFGGADLKTLFITSATFRLADEELRLQPMAGSLLKVPTDIRGRAEPRFAL
jgi:L-arabinonolactonase